MQLAPGAPQYHRTVGATQAADPIGVNAPDAPQSKQMLAPSVAENRPASQLKHACSSEALPIRGPYFAIPHFVHGGTPPGPHHPALHTQSALDVEPISEVLPSAQGLQIGFAFALSSFHVPTGHSEKGERHCAVVASHLVLPKQSFLENGHIETACSPEATQQQSRVRPLFDAEQVAVLDVREA